MTNLVAISDARANLPELVSKVNKNMDRVIITVNGQPKAVVLSPEELELSDLIYEKSFFLGDITKTFSGYPFQSELKEHGDIPAIGGKEIKRYKIKGVKGYFSKKFFSSLKNITLFKQNKIVSQRIVAHVTKPTDRIIIMSSFDNHDRITVNTVSNTTITKKDYELKPILLLLNSNITSWFAYRFIYAKAIRSMDFYDYFVGKIRVPNLLLKHQKTLAILADYLLFAYNIDANKNSTEKIIKELERVSDCVIYELFFISITNSNLLDLLSKDLQELNTVKHNTEKIEIIRKFVDRVKTYNFEQEINKICNNKFVRIIETQKII